MTFTANFHSTFSKLWLLIFFATYLAFSQSAIAGNEDSTPLNPIIIQPLKSKDGNAISLLPINPTFRNYLGDIASDRPHYYTTRTNVGPDGKVWVAYEVLGVTLDDSQSGGVKLDVNLAEINQAKSPPETLIFSTFEMVQNQVILGQAKELQEFINHPNNSWLNTSLREVFGNDVYSKFLDRLVAKGAHKKAVIIRQYDVFPGEPLSFLIRFNKGENFMPMAIRVSVGTNIDDLNHLFTKNAAGQYTYQGIQNVPWYQKYKTILILAFVIATFVGARAWLSKR